LKLSNIVSIGNSINRRCVKAFLDVIILLQLRNGGSSGYYILNKVRDDFNVLLSASTVYSVLESLKNDKYLCMECDGRRNIFRLTNMGYIYADSLIEEYEKFTSNLLGTNSIKQRYNF